MDIVVASAQRAAVLGVGRWRLLDAARRLARCFGSKGTILVMLGARAELPRGARLWALACAGTGRNEPMA